MQVKYEMSVTTVSGILNHYGYEDGESGEVMHGNNELFEKRLWVSPNQLNVVIDNILADTEKMGWRTNKSGATEIAIDVIIE